jgi:signal transduction histidine kinase/ActR/RegA family two-component response regulator
MLHVSDADQRISLVNSTFHRWCRQFGLPDDAVGRRVTELFSFLPPSVAAEYRQVFETGTPLLTENSSRVGDREVVTETRKIPLVQDGRVAQVITVVHDITARRKAELDRAKLEEQLAQAQKMEAIGRLAGGVAHDFNNILTGILGHTDFLLSTMPPEDPASADLEEIQKAAHRAASLTQQLLAFSRRQIIAPRIVNLNDAVGHATRMLSRIIGEDVDLVFSEGSDLWCVRIDPAQIDQILINLATNARDAMPDGGKLTIETSNSRIDGPPEAGQDEPPAGDFVMLAVSDDGIGMDQETRRQIFEPFFSTKPQGKGTGLELSMVHGIVKQNAGFITVSSEPQAGTTFKLYFVRVQGDAASPVPSTVSDIPSGQETILLVEDEDTVRRLARRVLQRQGYTVLEARVPEEALRICHNHPASIDLLLTDVIMPGINGRQLHERAKIVRPGLRVLFISGYTDDVIAHHGVLDAGMNFLQKPFTLEALARAVRTALNSIPSSIPR